MSATVFNNFFEFFGYSTKDILNNRRISIVL